MNFWGLTLGVHDTKIFILFFVGLVSLINGMKPENFPVKINYVFYPAQNMPISAKSGASWDEKARIFDEKDLSRRFSMI